MGGRCGLVARSESHTVKPFYERALEAEERAERAERHLAILERQFNEQDDWEGRARRLWIALRGIVDSDLSVDGMKSAARTILTANRWGEEK